MSGTRISRINDFLQHELVRRRLNEVPAVRAAAWLDHAGLLQDSRARPGKPLRDLLRDGRIGGGDQRPPRRSGRWFIIGQGEQSQSPPHPRAVRPVTTSRTGVSRRAPTKRLPSESVDALADAALMDLAGPASPLEAARSRVPEGPGLYAIHGDAHTWRELGLGHPADDRPLYVGKAEASLIARDLNTHFGRGRTGSSTVRRSVAALLRGTLGLTGVPRNPERPERPANFGLTDAHDRMLGEWMASRLSLATWSKPAECDSLLAVERVLLAHWKPPLNLRDNVSPWKADLLAARRRMADDARRWARARGLEI
jgi:hypothetical protein